MAASRKAFAKRRTLYGDQKHSFPALPTVNLQGKPETIRHGRYNNLYTASSRPPKLSSFEVTPRLGAKRFARFSKAN